jgi:hypothetical protein
MARLFDEHINIRGYNVRCIYGIVAMLSVIGLFLAVYVKYTQFKARMKFQGEAMRKLAPRAGGIDNGELLSSSSSASSMSASKNGKTSASHARVDGTSMARAHVAYVFGATGGDGNINDNHSLAAFIQAMHESPSARMFIDRDGP